MTFEFVLEGENKCCLNILWWLTPNWWRQCSSQMPNIGLLPSLHVFSLTHHSLDLRSYQCFSVSVSLPLTFTSAAPSPTLCHTPFFSKYSHLLASHTCFSACYSSSPPCSSTSCVQLLLSQQRWQRMPQSPPQSDTSSHCHSSSAATGALWHRKEGLDGVRADWGEEGCRTHWLHGTANIRLTGERAGRLPTGPRSRDTLQPTWRNTSVGGTYVCVCVCVLYGWMTSHVAHGGRWVQWRLNERGVVMAARSLSFVVRQKRKGGIRSLQQHMPPSAYSSALSDALFYYLIVNRDQYAPTSLLQ